jgi:glutathione S-transferase
VSAASPVELLGTPTSPYVRRVRIFARALGLPLTLTDTRTPEGQARLAALAPIGKVPTAVLPGGELRWDSRAICRALVARHGPGALRPDGDPEALDQLLLVVDGALDAGINAFYLRQGDPAAAGHPYVLKQQARMGATLSWVARRIDAAGRLDGQEGLGTAEVALGTALGWMRFRGTFPVAEHPGLLALSDAFEAHPLAAGTGPADPLA